jgi:hypothetical protein
MAAAFEQVRRYWYITYPIFTVAAVLMYGLMAGASVYAYRVLTDGEPRPNLP